jgi:hypothetical protein
VTRAQEYVVDQAEQAVLGACLLDPAQAEDLAWLEPADFRDPYRGQVWQVMREGPAGLVEVAAELVSRGGPAPQSAGWDHAVHLANLMEATPSPANAGVYATMTTADRMRRDLHVAGGWLADAANRADLDIVRDRTAKVAAQVGAAATRWREQVPTSARASVDQRVDITRQLELPQVRPTRNPERAFAEQAMVGSLLVDPQQLTDLAWIQARDLSDPGLAETLTRLDATWGRAREREPVVYDPLIVAADIASTRGPGSPMQVTALAGAGVPGKASYEAHRVAEHAVRDHTRSAAAALEGLSAAPDLGTTDRLRLARHAVRQAEADQERLLEVGPLYRVEFDREAHEQAMEWWQEMRRDLGLDRAAQRTPEVGPA